MTWVRLAPLRARRQRPSDTSVSARLRAQNRLFAKQFEADAEHSPETATSYGDYRFNARLDDYSLAASERQHRTDLAFRRSLAAIRTDGFSEQDRLSHDLLLDVLNQRIADFALKTYEMPLSQMDGVHLSLADLPRAVPFASVRDYENYIARLRQIPLALAQTTAVLQQGVHDGLVPPRIVLAHVPAQCEGVIRENPFLEPTTHYPPSVPTAEQKQLTRTVTTVVTSAVLPAYQRFCAFLSTRYVPHGRSSLGLSSLPQGRQRYQQAIREQTTTDMTPDQISALGREEVARLTGELTALAHEQGYPDLKSFRAALTTNPKYIPQSSEQIVADFERYLTQMQPQLPRFFGVHPSAPLTIEAVPPSQPGNATHYIPGTPNGSRPARLVVATADFSHRTLLSDEVLAYHEGVPGHHLQISIQQQLSGLPAFRLHVVNGAYVEGWAVYAESVAKEAGLFQDPGSEYGRLTTNLLRAARLVVDPGIHADGWSRERAVAYLRGIGAADEPVIQAEVDRYIAWPAQALSYKVGELTIRELRARAQRRLGARFDVRAFHDEVLGAGSVPLNLLSERIDRWVARGAATSP